MLPLLTTDWHLDDSPENEYRWQIIERVLHAVIQYKVGAIFVLGDIVDRKDRHSGVLVNRLVEELGKLAARAPVIILRGNHDTPLRGPAFWEFLSRIRNIEYVTHPTPFNLFNQSKPDLLLLPFTATPKETWRGIKFTDYRSMFMHATVTGAVVENGMVMENSKFPILPRSVKVYSGDAHTQQTVGGVTYVGAPHPVKFGDRFNCRMLLLDEKFGIAMELPLQGMHKFLLTVNDVNELAQYNVQPGDQVKIRFLCPQGDVTTWGLIDIAIKNWAEERGAIVAGTEVILDGLYDKARAADPGQSPEQILREFANQEGMADDLLTVGLSLLKETAP